MSIKARTIDNLGIDTSSRYARDKAILDTKLIEESRFIPAKTEISVSRPYVPTEFEEFLAPEKFILWASFGAPPEYLPYGKFLFSYQLIPSLGGYEKQESDEEKLEAMQVSLSESLQGGKIDAQEYQEREKERKKIRELLKKIGKMNRDITYINSRRNQYQRG